MKSGNMAPAGRILLRGPGICFPPGPDRNCV